MKSEGLGGLSAIGYRYGGSVTISYLSCLFSKGGWLAGRISLKIFAKDCTDGVFVVTGRSCSISLKELAIGRVC